MPAWEDTVAAAPGQNRLRDDIRGAEEDDGGADHAGEDGGGAEEDETVEL